MIDKDEMIKTIKESKSLSCEKVVYKEIFNSEVNFKDGLFMPNDLAMLAHYHHDLIKENMIHYLETEERIPAIVNIQRLMDETGITSELLDRFLFAGEMIIYYIDLGDLSPEEYMEERRNAYHPEEYELNAEDLDDLNDHMNQVADDINRRNEEIDMLTQMFAQGEN